MLSGDFLYLNESGFCVVMMSISMEDGGVDRTVIDCRQNQLAFGHNSRIKDVTVSVT